MRTLINFVSLPSIKRVHVARALAIGAVALAGSVVACSGGDPAAAPPAQVQTSMALGETHFNGTDSAGNDIVFAGKISNDLKSVSGTYDLTDASGAKAHAPTTEKLSAPSLMQVSDTEFTFADGGGTGRLTAFTYDLGLGTYSGDVQRADGLIFHVSGRLPDGYQSQTASMHVQNPAVLVPVLIVAAAVVALAIVVCGFIAVTSIVACAIRDRCWSYSSGSSVGTSSDTSVCSGSCAACVTNAIPMTGGPAAPDGGTDAGQVDKRG